MNYIKSIIIGGKESVLLLTAVCKHVPFNLPNTEVKLHNLSTTPCTNIWQNNITTALVFARIVVVNLNLLLLYNNL